MSTMRSLLVATLGVAVAAVGGTETAQTSSGDLLLASPATATLLGLQRGVRVQRKAPVPRDDDEQEKAEVESPSAARGIWEGAFADEDPAALSFVDVSVLGLQRKVKVVKKTRQTLSKQAAVSEQPAPRAAASPVAASLLSLQRGVRVQHKVPMLSTDDDEPEKAEVVARGVWQGALADEEDPAALSFADVSLLGLQRSVKVVKKKQQIPTRRAAAAASEQPPARAAAGPVAASLLSLQRGVRVQHKVPMSSTEDDEPKKAVVAARGVWQGALAEEEDPTALSFADVSVLGLQRSVKVVKKTKQTPSKRAPVSEQPAPRAAAAGGQDASRFLGPVDRSAEAQLMEA